MMLGGGEDARTMLPSPPAPWGPSAPWAPRDPSGPEGPIGPEGPEGPAGPEGPGMPPSSLNSENSDLSLESSSAKTEYLPATMSSGLWAGCPCLGVKNRANGFSNEERVLAMELGSETREVASLEIPCSTPVFRSAYNVETSSEKARVLSFSQSRYRPARSPRGPNKGRVASIWAPKTRERSVIACFTCLNSLIPVIVRTSSMADTTRKEPANSFIALFKFHLHCAYCSFNNKSSGDRELPLSHFLKAKSHRSLVGEALAFPFFHSSDFFIYSVSQSLVVNQFLPILTALSFPWRALNFR